MDKLDRFVQNICEAVLGLGCSSDAKRRAVHWTSLPWEPHYPRDKKNRFIGRFKSSFLTCAAEHGLTLYVSSKLQALGCNSESLAKNALLLIHAMGARAAKECQLNPDLIEVLLNYGYDPLTRFTTGVESILAWSALLEHEAGMDPPDLRWERWKKIAAIFVKHMRSPRQISKVENLLGQARSISRLSVGFVRKQLEERAEQLATIESPIQSGGRMPPEQPTRGAKRQKTNLGYGTSSSSR